MKNKKKENFHRLTNTGEFENSVRVGQTTFMQQAVFGFFTCEHVLDIWTVVQTIGRVPNYFLALRFYLAVRSTSF